MSAVAWLKSELERQGIPYKELHHFEAYTAQTVAEREHVPAHRVAKVVIVMADGRPVELILPANRCVMLDRVRGLLGAGDVRLATEEEMARYFNDCEVGAIPPFRHWGNVDVLMDASMKVDGNILFQAGTHCDAIHVAFEDWFRMVNPRVEHFSEPALAMMR